MTQAADRITTGRTVEWRVDWIDAARGLGIVLVVAGHVERGLVAAGIARGSAWNWFDYGLYCFHMPLFFLLAGLNVPGSLAKGRSRFLRAKLWTIAYPYVLWSLIQGSVLVALSSVTNGQAHVGDLLAIGWRPMGQFWFLYVLMICQLASLMLASRPRFLTAAAVVAFSLAAAMPQGGLVKDFLHAFPFFVAGILLADSGHRWVPGGDAVRAAAAALGLAAVIPLSGALDGMDFEAAAALPAAACGIVLMVSLARLLRGRPLAAARGLGRVSMTIYVMHILAASGARIALVRVHVAPHPWLYLAVCTATGIAVPIAAHAMLGRLGLLAPLGLAGPPRPRALPVAART